MNRLSASGVPDRSHVLLGSAIIARPPGLAVEPDRANGPVLTRMTPPDALLDELLRQIAAHLDAATGASVVATHDAWRVP